MPLRDLLSDIPANLRGEHLEDLLSRPGLTLQRIISPPGFRSQHYRQSEDEWVLLLQGEATLNLDGQEIDMHPGESLLITAGTPHQVLTTSAKPLCIWITLHLPETGQ